MSTPRAAVIDQLYAAAPSLIAAVTDPAVIADAPLKDRVAALTAVDKFLYHLEKLQAEIAQRPTTSSQQRTTEIAQRPAAGEPFGFEILYPGDPGYDDPNPWVWVDDDSDQQRTVDGNQQPAASDQQKTVAGDQQNAAERDQLPAHHSVLNPTPRTWDDGSADEERRAHQSARTRNALSFVPMD